MLLRELYEQNGKTAVVAFGRLNPPTIGHAKLVDKIKSIDGDHFLFLSHTQKPKTDPLDFQTKLKFAQQFFPGIKIGHEAVKTPVLALEYLQGQGYTDVIFVAGSDRVEGFQKLFDTYNGQPDKTGKVPFKFNSIRVVSAGERDPDADDVSGMSASKMRAAAAAGEIEAFAQGVPDKRLTKSMYDAVRTSMGVKESIPQINMKDIHRPLIKRKKDGEKYISYMDGNNGEFLVLHDNGRYMELSPENKAYLKKEFGLDENFADGKKPGRKGLAKRSGVNTKASVSSLRKTAKNSSGEKQRMAHWLANMKAGRAKKK